MSIKDRIPCLDHGYVQLLDCMGDDKAVVDAARLSISGEKVRPIQEDRGLIRYLMRHRHSTPLEQVQFKFMMKMPIFVARQFIRHRTASVNEMSARYSELPEEFYVPELDQIQYQSTKNKQGRSETVASYVAQDVQESFYQHSRSSFEHYHELLGQPTEPHGVFNTQEKLDVVRDGGGVARELARINLPLSTYTQWVWSQNLHNLLHLLGLRLDKHAQYEIRVFAEAISSIVKQVCPLVWESFEDFHPNMGGMSLSAQDVVAIFSLAQNGIGVDISHELFKTKREWEEFNEKRKRIGV